MPLIKSGSKPAISSNIRGMMRAGHPQDQSIAAALSTARKYGKKAGGGLKVAGKIVPPSIGGVMSKKPWKGYKHGGPVKKAGGGMLGMGGMGFLNMLDHPQGFAQMLMNPQQNDPSTMTPENMMQGIRTNKDHRNIYNDAGNIVDYDMKADGGATDDIFNSSDQAAMSPETFVNPLASKMVARAAMTAPNIMKNFVEGAEEYQPGNPETAGKITGASGDLVLNGLTNALGVRAPVKTGTAGVFVGPYGARALREETAAAGRPSLAHPAVSEAIKPELKGTSPKFRREAEGAQQDIMDDAAHQALEARAAAGNFGDRDVFPKSGWSFGSDLKPRKEVPDVGATLEKIPGTNKYELKHPAGDFHKIYNVPPIEHSPERLAKLQAKAAFDPKTGVVHISNPNDPNAVSFALHELQHAIQNKEGFAQGSNLARVESRPEVEQEYFPITDKYQTKGARPSWQKDMIKSQEERGANPEALLNAEHRARFATYQRSSGETEARNVQKRFEKDLYKEHPEDTEDVTRGLQWREGANSNINASSKMGDSIGKEYYDKVPMEMRTSRQGISHPGYRWEVYDPTSGKVMRDGIQTRSGASLSKDRLDNKYGAYRYQVRPSRASPEQMTEGELKFIKDNDIKFNRGGKVIRKAGGGSLSPIPWFVRSEARGSSGMLKSAIPGRTDKIPLNVPGGSYVLPADIPSALGQGNTMAGGTILDRMFSRGPYGMNLPKSRPGGGLPKTRRLSSLTKVSKLGFSSGGDTGTAKIIAAGGEHILTPDQVRMVGGGDLKRGWAVLDAFVKHVRKQNIKTLKGLAPPKAN